MNLTKKTLSAAAMSLLLAGMAGIATAGQGAGTRDAVTDGARASSPRDAFTDGARTDVRPDARRDARRDAFTDGARSGPAAPEVVIDGNPAA